MSQASWLVAGIVPGVDREPLKKLEPDGDALLRLLQRWRDEATKAGRMLKRVVVAYEAGRDRKSTRLNSSHANISYAVFCLKKKNKTNQHQQSTFRYTRP